MPELIFAGLAIVGAIALAIYAFVPTPLDPSKELPDEDIKV